MWLPIRWWTWSDCCPDTGTKNGRREILRPSVYKTLPRIIHASTARLPSGFGVGFSFLLRARRILVSAEF